ncbi:SDR family oxidoreductase (plasmid) [Paracoccus liaowanqingii]|uniref:SDR family oxidoreductase n=1 Tax=Paracoccus liaowanqingii TaxID=2560053 RepID=A0A4Y5SQZ0_9RHOB|nr:SDR family oxidoreductase [Paracoccus liaowanqingii]QDA35907.1 SDR family oxidoreductase [Paracoccus liaowanqingii]
MRDQPEYVIAVVTGASSGLGRALSFRLTAEGIHVVGIARNNLDLAETERGCKEGKFTPISCDVSNSAQIEAIAKSIEKSIGPVSILINNAALCVEQDFLGTSSDKIAEHVAINCLGPLYAAKAFIPPMLARNHGRIINVGSFAGDDPLVGKMGYSVSKAGARAFSKGLAKELEAFLPAVTVSEWIPSIMSTGIGRPEGISPDEAAYWGAALALDFRLEYHGLTFLKNKELIECRSFRNRVLDRVFFRPQKVPYVLEPRTRHTSQKAF